MIDIESQVFTAVKTAVGTSAVCRAESLRLPDEFPCVTVEEISNTEPQEYLDSSNEEKFARVNYRIQVFTNDKNTKKTRARTLMKTVDTTMRSLGFRRTSYMPRPAMYDATIYDIQCSYEALVDKNQVVYTHT